MCTEGYLQRTVKDSFVQLTGTAGLCLDTIRPLAKWEPEIQIWGDLAETTLKHWETDYV
jgi:hypothetical protein